MKATGSGKQQHHGLKCPPPLCNITKKRPRQQRHEEMECVEAAAKLAKERNPFEFDEEIFDTSDDEEQDPR